MTDPGSSQPEGSGQNAPAAARFQVAQPQAINIRNAEDKPRVWKLWKTSWQFFTGAAQLSALPKPDQANILMNALGPDVLEIYANWDLTQQQKDDPAELIKKFDTEFGLESTENLVFNTWKFLSIEQGALESFDEFLLKLRAASRLCKFNDVLEAMTTEERLVRDKIVLSIRSDEVRKKLLGEEKLTLVKAIQICRASEQTKKELRVMSGAGEEKLVDRIEAKQKTGLPKQTAAPCNYCGKRHERGKQNCPAADAKCRHCEKKGHFESVCYKKRTETTSNSERMEKPKVDTAAARSWDYEEDVCDEYDFRLADVVQSGGDARDWFEKVKIGGKWIEFKLDTGAQCSIVPQAIISTLKVTLRPSPTRCIVSYNGQKTDVIGEFTAVCECRGQQHKATLKVVPIEARPILCKNDCVQFGLVKRVDVAEDDAIFKGLGSFKNFEYRLEFVDNPQFKIHPARMVPHKIRQQVREELDKMEELGIIRRQMEPTPVVSNMVVVRRNDKIRVCLDPTEVNKNLRRRHFPLRSLEEIAARLEGSEWFTILDLKKGFWQIKVEKESQKFLTFGTPWGRYSYTCFPFGLSTGPELFQQKMTELFEGEEKIEISMDDCLLHARTEEELKQLEDRVIDTLRAEGLKLNKEKCLFRRKQVKFLGHVVSQEGLKPDPEKIEAVRNLLVPKDKRQVQRLLGMVTYLAKFIPNLSEITEPLRQLLRKENAFAWANEHQDAFDRIKIMMTTLPTLKFYDVNAENRLSVDCSSYAMGAVLMQDGRPIAYASKSLTAAQRNYPQLEKEALAIRFGCQKFHAHIYGRPVVIETDHKPLQTIFNKPLDRAPARLKRIVMDVKPYAPDVVYIKGKDIPIADALSRDVKNVPTAPSQNDCLEVDLILAISNRWALQIKQATKEDEELVRLARVIKDGWPETLDEVDSSVRKYFNFRDELSVYDEMIVKGDRVLIPRDLRLTVLERLHAGHFGVQAAIKRAKNVVFWIGLVDDIKRYSDTCGVCGQFSKSQQKEEMINKQIPRYAFQIVAVDIFEHERRRYLSIIDSFSGWVDFALLRTLEARETITMMKKWFAMNGVPEIVESDCGPQFDSALFDQFSRDWGFEWKPSSPHYHQANGLGERGVQISKGIVKRCLADGSDMDLALMNFRNTPRDGGLCSPNQRLQSRTCRTPLMIDQQKLYPKVVEEVPEKLSATRLRQKKFYDRSAVPEREPLKVDSPVRVQHPVTKQWSPGTVVAKSHLPRSYLVKTEKGTTLRRNSRFLRPMESEVPTGSNISVQRSLADMVPGHQITPPNTITPPSTPNTIRQPSPNAVSSSTTTSPIAVCPSTPSTPSVTRPATPAPQLAEQGTSRYGRQIRPKRDPDYVYY